MDVGLVCDACSTFNPMGARSCSKCGEALSLEPPGRGAEPAAASAAAPAAAGATPGPKPASAGRPCPSCGATVETGQRFCGGCGSPMPEETRPAVDLSKAPKGPSREVQPSATSSSKSAAKKTLFFGAMQQARAKLVLIKGDGLDGVSFTLAGEEHIAGREDAPLLFEEDPYLSPHHANFFYRKGVLMVRDEESVNGVFIRIRGSRPIQYGDRFLVGEQVLEVQETVSDTDSLEPMPDGTYFYASPRRKSHFRLLQLLRGGDTGLAYRSDSHMVTFGREGNDMNFPDDPFISGRHAQVSYEDGQLVLTDLGSKNGTFLRVTEDYKLEHGDYVFMGQQLLRVEIV